MIETKDDVYDYITLGDGDFTFSYDMIRFLQAHASLADAYSYELCGEEGGYGGGCCASDQSQSSERRDIGDIGDTRDVKVVCSGIDPLDELQQKYRDVDFILKKISSLNGEVPSLHVHNHVHSRSRVGVGLGGGKTSGDGCKPDKDENGSKRQRLDCHPTNTRLKNPSASSRSRLHVSIHHSVNAIQPWHDDDHDDADDDDDDAPLQFKLLDPSPPLPSNATFKNVIFNHPHIGTEDAQLHAQFLSHFFHSATNHWMARDGGILHLTLAMGQCERWECIERATQQGLKLIQRQTFKAPPSPGQYMNMRQRERNKKDKDTNENENGDGNENANIQVTTDIFDSKIFRSKEDFLCRYQHRRGHCGRSFKSRVNGSEILSFGRMHEVEVDIMKFRNDTGVNLPWQTLDYTQQGQGQGQGDKSLLLEKTLDCPHCNKSFRDERARKNHIKCVHTNMNIGSDSSRKMKQLICDLCAAGTSNSNSNSKRQNDRVRIFPNEEALEAHKRAKHPASAASGASDMEREEQKVTCIPVPVSETELRVIRGNDDGNNNNDSGRDMEKAKHDEPVPIIPIPIPVPVPMNTTLGKCNICGFRFTHVETRQKHHQEFIPIFKTSSETSRYSCSTCGKMFHQERALMQHRLACTCTCTRTRT